MNASIRHGALILAALLAICWILPWIAPLRDPAAQPSVSVLRDRPPLARVDAIRLRDGSLVFANELRPQPDGSIEYLRGPSWREVPADRVARGDWHVRPVFLLGTDGLGRDLLSRLLQGGRISLTVGLLSAAIALLVGTFVGFGAGLGGRWLDAVLMRVTDVFLAVPRLFLALLLVAMFGASWTSTVLVLGATSWMSAARLVRGELLSLRERTYVEAARAGGTGTWRIGLRHLLPGTLGPLSVEAVLRVGDSMLLEASLSFLGLGVQAPIASWGTLIADGRDSLFAAWWIATLPGLAIVLTVLALNRIGEGLRVMFSASGEAG